MAISHIPRSVGHNFTPEYQISAIPYMRSLTVGNTLVDEANDIKSFSFPKITQWISFKTSAATVTVYFCKEDAVSKKNGLIVASETTLPLHLRCVKLYFNNTAVNGGGDTGKSIQVRAGLTSIDSSEFNSVVETFLEANN